MFLLSNGFAARKKLKIRQKLFSVKYYLCEALNAANAVLQFYFTAWFLDGKFGQIATEGLFLEENESVLPILSECRLDL